jgi:hypothetical protein
MKKIALFFTAGLLLFGITPFFAAAQTTEERIETGRFGAEEPEAEDAGSGSGGHQDYWLFLGARVGPALRIYTPPEDTAFTGGDTYGLSLDAGLQVSVQIVPGFSLQAEAIFTWDDASAWFYALNPNNINPNNINVDRHTRKFTGLSLQFPLTAKLNFYPGIFRVSPFLGAYFLLPLGNMTIHDPLAGEESGPYSVSPPLGILGGLSVALPAGPGMFFADLRCAADLGLPEVKSGEELYRRGSVALCVGYELGLFRKGQTGNVK